MENIYEIKDEKTGAVLYSGSKKGMNVEIPQDHEVVEVGVTVTPKGSREPMHYYHRLVLRFSLEIHNARIFEERAEEARLQAIEDNIADLLMKIKVRDHLLTTFDKRVAEIAHKKGAIAKTPVKELKLLAKMDKFILSPKGNKADIVNAICTQMIARDDAEKVRVTTRNSTPPVVAPVVESKGDAQ